MSLRRLVLVCSSIVFLASASAAAQPSRAPAAQPHLGKSSKKRLKVAPRAPQGKQRRWLTFEELARELV